jgi:hypothetical protein
MRPKKKLTSTTHASLFLRTGGEGNERIIE